MSVKQLEERLELLEGSLTVGSPAEENLAELVSIVRGILDEVNSNDRILRELLVGVANARREERNAK